MTRWIYRILAGITLAGFLLLGQALWFDEPSAQTPAAWQSMDQGELIIRYPDGTRAQLTVRIADEPAERAQGMQNIPASVIRHEPIWFVFPRPQRTGWHMRNVKAPLDIVYVDANQRVIGQARMQPEGSGYGHDQPIQAALEMAAGEATRLQLSAGVRLNLREQ